MTGLWLSPEQLEGIAGNFEKELSKGLAEDGGMLKALPTFITKLPTGTEKGAYLVVDLGGSNLRVGCVLLHGDSTFSLDRLKWTLTSELQNATGPLLFDFIATSVKEYLETSAMRNKLADWPPRLGFTFSYPVRQERLAHGILIQWNKAVNCHDVVGQDVVVLLEEALDRAGLGIIKVGALLNDTVGTLVAHAYVDADTRIGVILGTGTNAAYVASPSSIPKLQNIHRHTSAQNQEPMIINTEWGAFGDKQPSYLPLTEADHKIDLESNNPRAQLFEKMVSGMYLGELCRLTLMELHKDMMMGADGPPFELDAADLSVIATGGPEAIRDISRRKLYIKNPDESLIKETCHLVVQRSARLCAAALIGLYRSMGSPKRRIVAAFDGSLYEHYPGYPELLREALDELEPGHSLISQIAKDESMVGAAAVLATH